MLPPIRSILFATLVLLAALSRGSTQNLNEPCTNPHGKPGRCVLLRECQPLLEIYRRNNLSYGESEFFYGSRCSGKFDGKPLLCCTSAPPSSSSASLPRPPSACGLGPSERIFGGSEATLGEFPWIALLMYRNPSGDLQMGCAASLVNARYVVTAAHCIKLIPAEFKLTAVLLGEHNITNPGQDCNQSECADVPVLVGVEKVIVHEQYDETKRAQYNDIALVRLERDVGFSEYIEPVCLPVEDKVRQMNHTGRKAIAAGWGVTENNHGSDVKRKLTLDVVDHGRCSSSVYKQTRIELRDTQLCAGGNQGEDTCRGDSGGPLMRSLDGNYYLIGVISWGAAACGTKDIPALYTNVAKFVDWIERNLE